MNSARALIKDLVRYPALNTGHELEIKRIPADNSVDWDLFRQLIIFHQLIPLVYLKLNDFLEILPVELVKLIKNTSYSTLKCSHCYWREFVRIAHAFEQSAVTFVPIKGVAFLVDIYQDTFLRSMVDMDLLVQENEFSKAEGILLDLGYKKDLHGLREEYWKENQ
jgi:hypothetical protein